MIMSRGDLLVHRRLDPILLGGAYRASIHQAQHEARRRRQGLDEDSKKVVEICTRYAQRHDPHLLDHLFGTLAFACLDPFLFIGYLIGLALFGLFQALFLANAGGAWDNAKKVVEVELKDKTSELHDAVVVGDTVGDPFKDTSSVAMNPIIKFATLFGLLAVELAVNLKEGGHAGLLLGLAIAFGGAMLFFVWRSFYGMRITGVEEETASSAAASPAE